MAAQLWEPSATRLPRIVPMSMRAGFIAVFLFAATSAYADDAAKTKFREIYQEMVKRAAEYDK